MIQNPYEILGIREGAGMDEIKRAYRKKAKEYHPDLHPDDSGANEKMQQVNEAYDMLCNPEKHRAQRQAAPNSNPGSGNGQGYWDGFANQGRQYRQGNWQYTYYSSADDPQFRRDWQNLWGHGFEKQSERRSSDIVHPFRGVFRMIGGILLFRFIISLLRFGWFGFF